MVVLISVAAIAVVALAEYVRYRHSPLCGWCKSRHYGRCIFNPRAGRIFANINDGRFDYNDPNQ